ncbi:hypothetical protein [Actinoplanes xinjiangensis]|uniref:Ribosomal L7/L12-like protein n=1 Tax=Actinoplanes xinjiangensis TaxID=512350 RepID=A0A316F867_9ACTN|nr:hypothetical protein [Actinoplanes xinjiangensis]PWK43383.1 hypothetical protein BC793_11365 [Actinoplanes xinjiangensis]GIF41700.1 hypothetical protein Axi01nite_60110 [Actinoplanes xinjiangensis]
MTTAALTVLAVGLLLLIAAAQVRRRARASAGSHPTTPEDLHAEIAAELARNGDVAAIRLYRQRTGASLVDAKAAVDRIGRQQP